MDKTLFTYVLTPEQAETLEQVTAGMSALKRVQAPYTTLALKGPKLTVMLYTSGKLVVQGKEAQDFVLFTQGRHLRPPRHLCRLHRRDHR